MLEMYIGLHYISVCISISVKISVYIHENKYKISALPILFIFYALVKKQNIDYQCSGPTPEIVI